MVARKPEDKPDKAAQDNLIEVAGYTVIEAVRQSAIRYGHIDPRGKTAVEAEEEFAQFLLKFLKQPSYFWVMDYKEDLLEQARLFRASGQNHLACLLYATWLEHWVNGIIDTYAGRKKLDRETTVQMLRDATTRAKLTWLFVLLSVCPEMP